MMNIFFEILCYGKYQNWFIWHSQRENRVHSGSENIDHSNSRKICLNYICCTMCSLIEKVNKIKLRNQMPSPQAITKYEILWLYFVAYVLMYFKGSQNLAHSKFLEIVFVQNHDPWYFITFTKKLTAKPAPSITSPMS